MISLDQQEHKTKPIIEQSIRGQVFDSEEENSPIDIDL